MDGFITFFVITFIFLPVIFCVLFIVFLTKTIQRGKRIKELEKEINDLKSGNANQAAQNTNAPYVNPQQTFVPQQNMMPGYSEQKYIQLPEIQSQGYFEPQAAPVFPAQPFASQAVPVAAPQTYATQNVTEPQINNAIPDQADFNGYCGAGIAFKIARRLLNNDTEKRQILLSLACLGTVCDVMELREENYVFVRNGLKCLKRRNTTTAGAYALVRRGAYYLGVGRVGRGRAFGLRLRRAEPLFRLHESQGHRHGAEKQPDQKN